MPGPGEILISHSEITSRVTELGRAISCDYAGKTPVLVTVLNGAVFFLSDLVKHISVQCMFDFMAISRYSPGGEEDGVVRITKDIGLDISGLPVILIEDIIDTGLTVSYLRKVILARKPQSFEVCTLLNRKARRIASINIKYWGFELPDIFVVGYGLDYQNLFRNLPDISRLQNDES